MTNQEHIDVIREAIQEFSERYGETCQYVESMNYAISALEAQELFNNSSTVANYSGDLIHRETARRIINSPRSREQMLKILASIIPVNNPMGFPSAQRWIPASEQLPFSEYGESDTVLATCRSRQWQDDYRWIKCLYYNGGVWCYPTGEVYEDIVTAWMPLPEPYQEESNGEV